MGKRKAILKFMKGGEKLKIYLILLIALLLTTCVSCEKPNEPEEYYHYYIDIQVDWSPDGTKLVFERAIYEPYNLVGGMYIYDFSDSSVTLFLENDIYYKPRFSPDGNWITYSYGKEIYIVKTDGDSLQLLTDSKNNYNAEWSPDGEKIIYEHRVGDDRGVHLYDLETKTDKLIHPYSSNPKWMPDGERIALFAWIDAEMHLIIIDTLGNTVQEFNDLNTYKSTMDVSPDGRYICFDQQFSGTDIKLYLLDTETGSINRLVPFESEFPAFSPDGNWLAFTRTEMYYGSIWLLNLETKQTKQITLLEFLK